MTKKSVKCDLMVLPNIISHSAISSPNPMSQCIFLRVHVTNSGGQKRTETLINYQLYRTDYKLVCFSVNTRQIFN